jgi:hypothetical protein
VLTNRVGLLVWVPNQDSNFAPSVNNVRHKPIVFSAGFCSGSPKIFEEHNLTEKTLARQSGLELRPID